MDTGFDFLIEKALDARKASYSPYSGYKVGSALLCKDGTIYTGCNIENASFSATICAERLSFFNAIKDGKRDFDAIAVTGGKNDSSSFSPPCGVCLQVMSEFCAPDFKIILLSDNKAKEYTLKELLPCSFTSSDIK